jgi:hypothetical protein
MRQKQKASLVIPVTLKNVLKQRAASENLFLVEYLSRLVLRDLGYDQASSLAFVGHEVGNHD